MTEENFFSGIKQHHLDRLPFVVHNSASYHSVEALLQQNDEIYSIEDYTESGFVFAPFDDQKRPVLFPGKVSERLFLKHMEFPAEKINKEYGEDQSSEQGKENHIRLVREAVKVLKANTLEKVVLSRREPVELGTMDPVDLFKALLRQYPDAFVYCWYHPKVGIWLGATPETLLKVNGRRFETMALAGTQKFNGEPDPEWGQKEIQEQRYVTDSILENLQKNNVRSIQTEGPYTTRAGNLLHLRTDIKGNLDLHTRSTDSIHGVSPESSEKTEMNEKNTYRDAINAVSTDNQNTGNLKHIISALHPTPAVCGLPKEEAKDFILKKEGYDREFYTGFLGELNYQQVTQRSRTRRNVENLAYRAVKKETSLFVNLRCMKLEEGKAVLFIGGGITKDSVPEDEWQETVNKSQTIKKVLI